MLAFTSYFFPAFITGVFKFGCEPQLSFFVFLASLALMAAARGEIAPGVALRYTLVADLTFIGLWWLGKVTCADEFVALSFLLAGSKSVELVCQRKGINFVKKLRKPFDTLLSKLSARISKMKKK